MLKKKINIYCIIPAKKRSIRLKNKNIKKINKKHLIGHVIKNVKKTKLFKKIIVSSDSGNIHKIANQYGKVQNYKRDISLSDSFTGTDDVVRDVIKKMSIDKKDIIMCIYPTAVLANSKIIISSYKKFLKNKMKCLISVKEFNHPIQRAFQINNKNSIIKKINNKSTNKRTQDLKKFYHDAGQFYWATAEKWLKNKNILNNETYSFLLKSFEAIDIDNEEDFQHLKQILK
jgi:pseudaminic acid cytidylyltransferase